MYMNKNTVYDRLPLNFAKFGFQINSRNQTLSVTPASFFKNFATDRTKFCFWHFFLKWCYFLWGFSTTSFYLGNWRCNYWGFHNIYLFNNGANPSKFFSFSSFFPLPLVLIATDHFSSLSENNSVSQESFFTHSLTDLLLWLS